MKLLHLVGVVVLLSGISSLVFLRYSRLERSNQRRPVERHVADRRSLELQQATSSYMQPFEEMLEEETYKTPRSSNAATRCSMRTCFDFSRCEKAFKVYVYPQNSGDKRSLMYLKILRALKENKYYTSDPREACVFIPSVDTLDRDRLSPDYIHGLAAKIKSLPLWNGGRNHLLFNTYSGTWPDYYEHLDFDFGEAMLARASVSTGMMRPEFDISIPLIPKSHPEKGGRSGSLAENGRLFPVKKKYLLAFKGKRYLTGIGSETRNALSLIHDGEEIVLVTTCQHGKGWEKHKDGKCDEDQVKFDSYDYHDLLHKSTFCLVPRGRRLGSFRFLETVEANCIPVSLSNRYALPLAEKIDWSRAIISVDERLILQLPEIVRGIPASKILEMRQQLQFLWNAYFSSVDKLIMSILEVIHDRVLQYKAREYYAWNLPPGALVVDSLYSPWLPTLPFYSGLGLAAPAEEFTAVIVAYSTVTKASAPLFNLIREVGKCQGLVKVLVLWMCDTMPPKATQWPAISVPTDVEVLEGKDKVVSSRFNVAHKVHTDAILMLDEDTLLIQDEIEFAFSVWLRHPDRIIGFPARNHFWDSTKSRWGYTSKWTNDYSMILTAAAFLHRFYCHLYVTYLPTTIRNLVDQTSNCDDIAMNFLVSHVTKKSPIKVTQKKQYWETNSQASSQRMARWMNPTHFSQRQTCINMFSNVFGYMPLMRSQFRYDPVLFKDPVAMLKKKYKRLDLL